MNIKLTRRHCIPCEGGELPLPKKKVKEHLKKVTGWEYLEEPTAGTQGRKHPLIRRVIKFKDFVQAMKFVNKVADLAESEGHHPDIYIYQWNHLRLDLWTHATGGLHENDFIMAAKIDKLG